MADVETAPNSHSVEESPPTAATRPFFQSLALLFRLQGRAERRGGIRRSGARNGIRPASTANSAE